MNPLSRDFVMTYTDDDLGIVNAEDVDDVPGLQMGLTNGHKVSSYVELLRKIAALSYWNSRFRLLFRGQSDDYKMPNDGDSRARSCLYPTILRNKREGGDIHKTLDDRFALLREAERLLKCKLLIGDIHRDRPVQWALLQHYGVCSTPFLDVTNSVQTAISFALAKNPSTGFLYAFAFPQLTGAVSVSVESMTQVIDLSQICRPEALRPHFQSGLLAADYPLYTTREETHGQKGFLGNSFVCRLLAKFHLVDCDRWKSEGFTPTPESILYPDDHDEWFNQLNEVKNELKEL